MPRKTRPRRAEPDLQLLVEGMADAVFVHQDGVICYANPAMAALLGADGPGALLGKDPLTTFVHPEDRQATRELDEGRAAGDPLRVLRIRWVRSDGQIVFVEGVSTPITHDDRPAVAVVVRDITARLIEQEKQRSVERSLALSEERYRLLFEGSPMAILLFDPHTLHLLDVNEAAVALYGYTRDELSRMKLTALKTHEDEELQRGMREIQTGARRLWRGVKKHRRKDGTTLDVEIASHPVLVGGRPAVLMLASDVSERARLEDQLRQSQKMEAIGRFAGGIAHDFNNILAVVLANSEYLRSELGETHELYEEARDIESAAQRGAALTRQMLTFSRRQPTEPCVLSLNTRIADLGKMLSRIIGEDVAIQTTLDPRLGSVNADPGQMDQVLLNLVVNARDAMPKGGNLVIETANVELAPTEAKLLGLEPGSYVKLKVQDSGVGMDAAVQARIFEPFFTTKEVGKGTGLGLSTVFGILKQSGGGIAVDSEPGWGTTFRAYLPRIDTDGATSSSEGPSSPRAREVGTILVVEDEQPVRRVVCRLLTSRGYTVLDADGAASALQMFEDPANAVDLVLTDLVMPDMDGLTMAGRMRERRPDIRVLFMSGYSEHPTLQGAGLQPTDTLIHKPFTIGTLTAAVTRALAAVDAERTPSVATTSGDLLAPRSRGR